MLLNHIMIIYKIMKVLKATSEQKEKIEALTSGVHLIRFTQDADGEWIVGKQILNNPKFSHIDELKDLVEIDYEPIAENIE